MQKLLLQKVTNSREMTEIERKLSHYRGSVFLDESPEVPQIVYSSYLRSGNTFLRNYLENISGIITGST